MSDMTQTASDLLKSSANLDLVKSLRCITKQLVHIPFRPRHEHYYLPDGGTVFLVENTLFRIPRHLLINESPVFADMFRIPNWNSSEGFLDTAPIQLQQVECTDFERLLELLYPLTFSKISTGTKHWGQGEWKSILHLASMWQMDDVRTRAIAQLSACATPTAKIVYGRTYDHSPWVQDGYRELCVRCKPFTVEEAEGLSLKEIIGVAEARERIRSEVMNSSTSQTIMWPEVGMQRPQVKTQYTLPDDEHHNLLIHRILQQVFDIKEPFVSRHLRSSVATP